MRAPRAQLYSGSYDLARCWHASAGGAGGWDFVFDLIDTPRDSDASGGQGHRNGVELERECARMLEYGAVLTRCELLELSRKC
jgi:hypothetical protein